jgi:very-short-patch-repair endonuclease
VLTCGTWVARIEGVDAPCHPHGAKVHEPIDAAVARLAARRHGVVSVTELLGLGMTRRMVGRRVERGILHRVHRGVYAVGHRNLTPLGRDMAAVLSAGRGAVLSHRSAAHLWDIRPYTRGRPDVTVPTTGRHKRRDVHLHTSLSLEAVDVTSLHGIPITTPERTLIDLADRLAATALTRAVGRAKRLGLVPAEVGRRDGRRTLPAKTPFTRSQLEAHFYALLRARRFPEPLVNHPIGPYEADFHWPGLRLVVELDTFATHGDPAAFHRDRRKDRYLRVRGITVLRITEPDLDEGLRDLAGLLALASTA